MSQENVARFIKAIGDNEPLNKKMADADQNVATWVTMGKEAGIEFSSDDVVQFASKVTGEQATADNAVSLLLSKGQGEEGELSDSELAAVAGGISGFGSFSFSSSLYKSISTSFPSLGDGFLNSFVKTSGPSFVKS